MEVAPIQLIEDLNKAKSLSKRELLLPDCLELEHWTQSETLTLLGS